MVEQLFLAVPRGCLQFVIVVFPDHTHLLFLSTVCDCGISWSYILTFWLLAVVRGWLSLFIVVHIVCACVRSCVCVRAYVCRGCWSLFFVQHLVSFLVLQSSVWEEREREREREREGGER